MAVERFKEGLIRNFTNIKGFKTERKIIVFESDDWGSIMMKDAKTYDRLLKSGIGVDKSLYSKFDCLETRRDLNDLFNILNSHRDFKKNPAVFTFNTVMENPDFEKIREADFDAYYGEGFSNSYKTYYNEDNVDLWFKAMEEGLMVPQFHAREHFNRFFWMEDLKKKNRDTLIGFDNHFFGMGLQTTSSIRKRYLPTYYAESVEEHKLIQKNLINGLGSFKKIFGFNSKTFIASNYTWSPELEVVLNKQKVRGIQGSRVQLAPNVSNGKIKKIRRFTGDRNNFHQLYTVRNVNFEPYSDLDRDWISSTLNSIENSFFWRKPAIIETHRINYVSSLSEKNKERNLGLLDQLLKKLLKLYPEVEFLSSDALLDVLQADKNN